VALNHLITEGGNFGVPEQIILACLTQLTDQGLLYEPTGGKFRAV
jgi:hypothetical protein